MSLDETKVQFLAHCYTIKWACYCVGNGDSNVSNENFLAVNIILITTHKVGQVLFLVAVGFVPVMGVLFCPVVKFQEVDL